jgi:hypothetical protein
MIQLPEERARRLSRLRLRVAMHRASLDAQLAGGADPLDRPELALRAVQLQSRHERQTLAQMLRRIVAEAGGPLRPIQTTPVILARRAIRSEQDELLALAQRLESSGGAHVQGIALAHVLVSDVSLSPIYLQSERGRIGELARQAIACMDGPSPTPVRWPAKPSSQVGARAGRWGSTTVLISDDPGNDQVIARRSGIRDRLLARVHADRLDQDLAAGLCPDSDLVLSVRAHRLIGLDSRRAIADAIGSLVRTAQEPRDSLSRRTPLCRHKILQAAEPLHELACRLSAPGPANARGVAQARLLLTNGAGPLYLRPELDDLAPVVRRAVGALDLELGDWDL